MYSATAYNHAYADSGLFCIHASAPPSHVRELVEVIVREIVNMCASVSEQELRVGSFLFVWEFITPSRYLPILSMYYT